MLLTMFKKYHYNSTVQGSYRAGNDTHILGVLFEPVVHVLTDSKKVVETRSLFGRPVAFRHLLKGKGGTK